ncbi:MAG: hypothetical protein R3E76_07490 [Planctomycetota bacterium]
MTDVRDMFARALRDELSPSELAEFESALERDPALSAEFERFADAQAGGGLENITGWLERAGQQGNDLPDVYRAMGAELIQQTSRKKRGRLIQLVAAASAVAAAAVIVAVLILPTKTDTPTEWPEDTEGQVAVLYDNYRHFEAAYSMQPASGVALDIEANSLTRPHQRGCRLDRGRVHVALEDGASYEILVGNRRISAQGPGEFEVSAEPQRYTALSPIHPEKDPMFDSKLLARFGAQGFALTLSVIAGSATLHGANAPQVVMAPQTIQAQAGPGQQQPPAPPTANDVFTHLDRNADGKLDNKEVPQQMINDFDDDSSGDVDLTEFTAHWKPPLPLDPDMAFDALDKNKDGVIDSNETNAQMITDMDGDNSGDIDRAEFKANYKPAEHEFNKLDKNSDGVIDSNEAPQKMINDFDDDSSGDVDLAEFTAHWKPQPPQGPGPGPGGQQGTPDDHFNHLDLNSDGELDSTEVPGSMITDMDDDSNGSISLAEFKAHPPKKPNPDDAFDNLDANSDGKLDSNEADQRMLNDFDDDNDGEISKAEFKAHWRPMPKKPDDAFNELDKNSDGVLDSSEVPQALINDWDDDNSGDVDLSEFKAHHKPPQGPGGNGPGGNGPGNGPGGPGKGPGGPGGGPGGPGGGPGGPGGPGGNGPKPPRPPHR